MKNMGNLHYQKDVIERSADYKALWDILVQAYSRASLGKGHERHSHGELFTDQYILRGPRTFGLGALLFQIGKKNEEIMNIAEPDRQINELLDIIVYAAAGVLFLKETL